MRLSRFVLQQLVVSLTLTAAAAQAMADEVQIESVLLRIIDQVEVPARDQGVLDRVAVREGQLVEPGELLAQIEDTEARLALERAKLQLDMATAKAENDVNVRFARKAHQVAEAELNRATEAVEKYKKSVSQSEIDRLRLAVQKTALQIEQAQHELELARFTQRVKKNDLQRAEREVARRKIVAPFDGIVTRIDGRAGEWVEPGQKLLRIVRLDQLRAEGFLDVKQVSKNMVGRAVTLFVDLPEQPQATFAGKIVFISPEIDPVNNQVRVWAEIENADLLLKPGMRAQITIADE